MNDIDSSHRVNYSRLCDLSLRSDLWIRSIGITWELVKSENSQPHPKSTKSKSAFQPDPLVIHI